MSKVIENHEVYLGVETYEVSLCFVAIVMVV